MKWCKQREHEYCQECFKEYLANNTPVHLRKPVLASACRKHNRPNIFSCAESAFYVQLYSRIAGYNEIREVKKGEAQYSIQLINVSVLQIFCQELDLDFLQTFEILQKIAEQWSVEHG